MGFFRKLIDSEYKELKRFNEIATKIDALDEEYSKLSDKKLAAKTDEFKKRLEEGETLDEKYKNYIYSCEHRAANCSGVLFGISIFAG